MMKRGGDGAGGWRGAVAPVLLVALVLPAILWRAGLESSLWIDEVYSLQIVHFTPAQIVDLSARDAHPPGYYLALKGWLKGARLAGIEPGVAWARSLGVAVWLALVAVVWGMVRRLGGRGAAGVAVWAVCGAAVAAALAVQLRGYLLVFAAAVVAFLAALLAEREAGEGRRALAWWLLYALMAAGALWTHLLAAPLLAVLAIAWLAVSTAGPAPRRRRLALGASAHLAAALAFLPWLARVPGQLAGFERSGTDWMTPATGRQLSFVVTYWFPVGPVALPDVPPYAWLNLIGAVALLMPLAAAGLALARRRAGRVGPLAAAAAAGGVFAVLLWALDRFGVVSVFHGPRYPLLAAGLWGLGLAGLALAGAGLAAGELVNQSPAVASAAGRSSIHQLPTRLRLAWLLLAPWLAAACRRRGRRSRPRSVRPASRSMCRPPSWRRSSAAAWPG
jgi:mannosyltransferase